VSFGAPALLWTLLLVPAAVALYVVAQRRRVRYAARFTNLDLLANVVDASPGRRRHVPAVFALAALAALLLALARPQMTVAVARDEATVVLTLDTSGSMMATDVSPTRLAAAQSAAASFLDGLPRRVRVGVVSFASGANVLVPPTEDRDSVRSALEGMQAAGGTALGEAIVRASELAPEDAAAGGRNSEAPFSILLLSDGANSIGIDPASATARAQEAGVPIYTVALGTDQGVVDVRDDYGVPQRVRVPPDRDTLRQIADDTGGRYFEALTAVDLEQIYDEIGSQVAYQDEKREVTAALAGAGALLLVLGGTLSLLWFGRIP
jgi:Ca-activated chloride channel family protein